jgi:protease-4
MNKWVVIVALLLFMVFSLSSCSIATNKIAVISLSGAIQAENGFSLLGGTGITPALVRTQLERANKDFAVKAIVIQVNSPGGDVSACEEIKYEMGKVHKPVVVSMRTIAASGGYFISAGADKIVALPTTNTGSIGVITYIPNMSKLFDKIGVNMQVIKSGKYKDMYSGFKELTPEETQLIQRNADQAYELFIDVVAKGRKMDKEKVRLLATGQLYNGIEARELGLVDEIGGLQTAIDLAAKLANIEKPAVDYYEQDSGDLLRLLLGMRAGVTVRDLAPDLAASESAILQNILGYTYPRYIY